MFFFFKDRNEKFTERKVVGNGSWLFGLALILEDDEKQYTAVRKRAIEGVRWNYLYEFVRARIKPRGVSLSVGSKAYMRSYRTSGTRRL